MIMSRRVTEQEYLANNGRRKSSTVAICTLLRYQRINQMSYTVNFIKINHRVKVISTICILTFIDGFAL